MKLEWKGFKIVLEKKNKKAEKIRKVLGDNNVQEMIERKDMIEFFFEYIRDKEGQWIEQREVMKQVPACSLDNYDLKMDLRFHVAGRANRKMLGWYMREGWIEKKNSNKDEETLYRYREGFSIHAHMIPLVLLCIFNLILVLL